METATNPIDNEILQDLKNDITNIESPDSASRVENPGEVKPEITPSFLPLPLIKYSVVGKNSLMVHFIAKNIPGASPDLLKDHFKPTEEEINLYKKFLEALIWKHFRSVAEWFMRNDAMSVGGEILLFETVRLMPILSLIKTEDKKGEDKKNEQG